MILTIVIAAALLQHIECQVPHKRKAQMSCATSDSTNTAERLQAALDGSFAFTNSLLPSNDLSEESETQLFYEILPKENDGIIGTMHHIWTTIMQDAHFESHGFSSLTNIHIIANIRDALKKSRDALNQPGDIQNELWLSCIAKCDERLSEEQRYHIQHQLMFYDDTVQC